jgi:hypothetical protein
MFAETTRQEIFVVSVVMLFSVMVFLSAIMVMSKKSPVGLKVAGICISALFHPLIFHALTTDRDGIPLVSTIVLMAAIDAIAIPFAWLANRSPGRSQTNA